MRGTKRKTEKPAQISASQPPGMTRAAGVEGTSSDRLVGAGRTELVDFLDEIESREEHDKHPYDEDQ